MSTSSSSELVLTVADRMAVCDPCEVDEYSGGQPSIVIGDCAGAWKVSHVGVDLGRYWGPRVAKFVLTRADSTPVGEAEEIGWVGVDSGHVVAFDHQLLAEEQYGLPYDDICVVALANRTPAAMPEMECVVTPTGIGDGGYSVYVERDAAGRPARITVDFELTEEMAAEFRAGDAERDKSRARIAAEEAERAAEGRFQA